MGATLAFPFSQEFLYCLRVFMLGVAFTAERLHLGSAEENIRLCGGFLIVRVDRGDAMAVGAGHALLKVGRGDVLGLKVDVADQADAVILGQRRIMVLAGGCKDDNQASDRCYQHADRQFRFHTHFHSLSH